MPILQNLNLTITKTKYCQIKHFIHTLTHLHYPESQNGYVTTNPSGNDETWFRNEKQPRGVVLGNLSPESPVTKTEKEEEEDKEKQNAKGILFRSWSSSSYTNNNKGDEQKPDKQEYQGVKVNSGSGFSLASQSKKKKTGKSRVYWVCSNCGNSTSQWWGCCPYCEDVGNMTQFIHTDFVEDDVGAGVASTTLRGRVTGRRRRPGKERDDKEKDYDGDSKRNEAGKFTCSKSLEFKRDFIELCLEEVNSPGQMSWKTIGEKLSQKYGHMSGIKLKNQWCWLKGHYVKKVKNGTESSEDADLRKRLFGDKISNGDIISLTMVEQVEEPQRRANVNVPLLVGTSAPVVETVALEEPEPTPHIDQEEDPYLQDVSSEDTRDTFDLPQPTRRIDQEEDPYLQDVSIEETRDTFDSPVPVNQMNVEASSSSGKKVDNVVEVLDKHFQQIQIALEKQQIAFEKQQIAFEKQQSGLEKKDEDLALAVRFIKTLEELKDAGHISFDDTLEVATKVSELFGWQMLFVSLPTIQHRVSYVNILLGRRRNSD